MILAAKTLVGTRGRVALLAVLLLALAALGMQTISAASSTVGNALSLRCCADGAQTTFVHEQSFGAATVGGALTTWSFYSHPGTNGRNLTPLLLESAGGGNYTVRAIGQTRQVGTGGIVENGANTGLAFNTQAGDPTIVNGNYFFGWKDGSQTSANQGVISFGTSGAGFNMRALNGNSSQNITAANIGSTLPFGNFLGTRAYSFQATAATTADVLAFVEVHKDGVGGVDGLDGVLTVAVSPDGENVYAASRLDDALVVFSRDSSTGELTFEELQKNGAGTVVGLNGAHAVTVSPDGAQVYVGSQNDKSVVVFDRDASGNLTFVERHKDGVSGVDGLDAVSGIAMSPDGANVYSVSISDDSVAVFKRNANGTLQWLERWRDGVGGVDGLNNGRGIAVSPDGNNVYATGITDAGLAVFTRDPNNDGRLAFEQVIKDTDAGVDGLVGSYGVGVSPDGAHVYVTAATDDAVVVFSRNSSNSGRLTFEDVIKDTDAGVDGLDNAREFAFSPDGGQVYVAGGVDNTLAVFDRDSVTGDLTFIEVHSDGVGGVDGLVAPNGVAVSPGGDHVYVAGVAEDAVAVFSAGAQSYSDTVLSLSPAVYYTFDNVAGSVINEGYTGAPDNGALSNGASITTSGGGQFGEAMSTAIGQYLLIGSSGVDISASGWTTSAWFKGIYPVGDWRTLYRGSENDHQLIVEYNSRRLGIYDNTSTGFNPSGFDVSAIDDDGEWHHITSRGNASYTTDLFVDGVFVGTSNTRSPYNITWVGGCCGASQTWGPLIDEVAIFTRPLTDAEIGQLAQGAAPVNTAPNCDDDSVSIPADTAVSRDLSLSCSDDDGDPIDIEIVSLSLVSVDPINVPGPLPFTLPLGSVDLDPDTGFYGNGGTLTFRAVDSEGALSDDKILTVTVLPPPAFYDEAVHGDLGTVGAATNLGLLGAGSYDVRGTTTLGDRDFFTFEVGSGLQLVDLTLDSLAPSDSNIAFNLDLSGCCSLASFTLTPARVGTDLLNGNDGPSGVYDGSLFHFSAPSSNPAYQFTITVAAPPAVSAGNDATILEGETYAQTVPDGYWSLDDGAGTTVTESINGIINGAFVDAPAWSTDTAFGSSLYSLDFDGFNDYVNFGDILDVGVGSFTFSVWYKADAAGATQVLLVKGLTSGHDGYEILLHLGQLRFDLQGSGASAFNITTPEPSAGVWHHVAGVLDRVTNTASLYVDGVLADSEDVSHVGNLDNPVSLGIGALNREGAVGSPVQFFNGKIDELRLYNNALTAAEVAVLAGGATHGSFNDPDSTSWTATVDYGDGSGVQALPLSGKSFGLSHLYSNPGLFTVTVVVTDDGALVGSDTLNVTVLDINFDPTVSADNDPVVVDEGDTAANTGLVDDADGDTVTLTASVGTVVNNGNGTWSWSFDSTDGSAETQIVTIDADDGNGGTASTDFDLTVNNLDPVVQSLSATSPVDEGDSTTLTGTFTDVPADTHTVDVDWGDASPTTAATLSAGIPSLLAFFPFDGNTNDVSGNGHTGTPFNGPALTTGFEGQAYQFDGSNDYIRTSVNINPSAHPRLTMGAWVNVPASANPIRQIIAQDNCCYDRGVGLDSRGGGVGWSAFAGGSYGVLGYEPVNVGQWTFVAVVYDSVAQTVTLYVDGSVFSKPANPSDGTFTDIGRNPTYGEYFLGTIDNVFFYSDALTASQVATIRDNGSAAILGGGSFSATHAYGHAGTYTATATVTDDDGGVAVSTTTIQVDNVAPTVTSASASPTFIDEGQSTIVTATFSDPSWLDTHTATVDCDGGTLVSQTLTTDPISAPSPLTGSVTAECAYDDDDPGVTAFDVRSITITVTDDLGASGDDDAIVTVNNVAPDFEAGSNELLLPPVAGVFSRTGLTFTDPGADDWSGTVNFGDGPNEPLSINQIGKSFDLGHTYTADGLFTVTVTVVDDDSGTWVDAFTVEVQLNTPPTADAGGPYTGDEGSPVAFDGSGSTDNENNIVSYEWTFGDSGTGTGINPSHTYADNGTFTVCLTVTDAFGEDDTACTTAEIDNVDPVVEAGDDVDVDEGTEFSLAISRDGGGPTLPSDLFVSSELTNQVLRYDAATGASQGVFASVAPHYTEGLAFGPDGNLYVATYSGNKVQRFDGTTGAFIDNFVPSVGNPVGVAFGPNGDFYVASRATSSIQRYDGTTGAFLGIFAVGGLSQPDFFTFGPNGDLYVSSRASHQVLRFDGTNGASLGVFASGSGLSRPEGLTFGSDGNLYVASYNTNNVLRYDGTGAFIDVFASGGGLNGPFGMVFGPDGNLYIANYGSDSVLRFDGTTGAFIDTFVAVGSGGLDAPTSLMFQGALQASSDGSFTDPGDDTFTATADYGDGSPVENFSGESFTLAHTYGHAGTYTVSVTVSDDDSGSGSDTFIANVANVAPSITSVSIAPLSLFEGQSAVVTAEFTDPSWLDTHTATIDCGTGTLVSGPTLVEENNAPDSTGTVTGECSFDDDQPTTTPIDLDTIIVTVTDDLGASDDGSVGTLSDGITIINVAPVVDVGPDVDVDEGTEFSRPVSRDTASSGGGSLPDALSNWPGDNNAIDVISGNNGTLKNGAGFAPGHVDQAFSLDGANDYVEIGSPSDFAQGDYTITGWFNTSATTAQDVFAATKVGTNGHGILIEVRQDPDPFTSSPGGLRWLHRPSAGSSGGTNLLSPGKVNDGQFHHFAAVRDGSVSTLYVDGVAVASGVTASPIAYDVDMVFGRLGKGLSGRYFNGLIDDIRIYGSAFTPTEIGEVIASGDPSGSFTDPGDDTFTATADYGDGSPVENFSGESFTLAHTYGHAGTYTVTVTVTDDDSGAGTDTFTANVANVAPTVTSISASPTFIDEGQSTTVTATFSDPSWLDTHTATIHCDGGTLVSQTLTIDPISGPSPLTGTVTAECGYDDDNPTVTAFDTRSITVTVTDDLGASDDGVAIVTVNNVAPVVDAGPAVDVDEGTEFDRTITRFGGVGGAASVASCTDIQLSGSSTGDGVYGIDPDGDGNFTNVYCDMTTDGGGWTLVGYGASSNLLGRLNTANGTYNPTSRSGSANINGLDLAHISTEAALSWSNSAANGNLGTYAEAVGYAIPNPTGQTLDPIGGGYACTSSQWTPVTVNTLVGAPNLPSLMYTRTGSLGAVYGLGYGLVRSSSNPQCDWGIDGQTFKAVYLGINTGTGARGVVYEPGGNTNHVVPNTMAIWMRGDTLTPPPAAGPNTFTDPGDDTFTATADYGDGSPVENFSGESFTLAHTYGHAGTYTVTLTVSDDDSGVGVDTFTANVANVAPTVTSVSASPSSIDEGQSVFVTAEFTDPSWLDTHTAAVDCDGGTLVGLPVLVEENLFPDSTGTVTAECAYDDDDPTVTSSDVRSITVTVTDDLNDSGSASASATVNNVAPDFEAGANELLLPPVVGVFSRTGLTFTDPGADVWTGTVNYGDGPDEPLSINQAGKSFDLGHTYVADGLYTVTVTVNDDDSGSHVDTFTVEVQLNTPPTADVGGPYTGDEGSPVAFDGSGSTDNENNIVSYDWTFGDTGTGAGINPSHTYADNGTYTVCLTVTDAFTETDTECTTATIANVDPVVEAGDDIDVDEGTEFTFGGGASGVFYSEDFQGAIGSEWSSSTTYTSTTTGSTALGTFLNSPTTLTLTGLGAHTELTLDFELHLQGSWDGNGIPICCGPDIVDVTVAGGPTLLHSTFSNTGQYQTYPSSHPGPNNPSGNGATIGTGATDSMYALSFTFPHTGSTFSVDFSGTGLTDENYGLDNVTVSSDAPPAGAFSDAGVLDTHTATIDWSDSNVESGTVTESGGSGNVTGTHAYGHAGDYTVTVTVTDNDGGIGSDTFVAHVANVAPTITSISTSPTFIDEGQSTTVTANFTDPSWMDTHTATVDCDGGTLVSQTLTVDPISAPLALTGTVTAECTYDDDNPTVTAFDVRTITVTVIDDLGASDDDAAIATVNNVAPVVDAGGDISGDEGSVLSRAGVSLPNPLAYLPLDDGIGSPIAADVVGGNDGTLINMDPGSDWVPGSPNITFPNPGALDFDGSNDYITLGNVLNAGTGDWSVSLWYYATNASTAPEVLLVKGRTGGAAGYELLLNAGSLYWDVASTSISHGFAVPEPSLNEWHHIVGVVDRSSATSNLYVDGVLAGSASIAGMGSMDNSVHVGIGALNRAGASGPTVQFFSGQMDDIRIFDSAISAAQAAALAAGGNGGGSFSDPGADTWTGTVDYGDGSGVQALALNPGKTFDISHAYGHAGDYTVTVTVSDDDSGVGSDTFMAHVANVAPTITAISATPSVFDEGQSTIVTALFTDPSWLDTHTASVDCDGGTLVSGPTVVEENDAPDSTGTVTAECSYDDDDPSVSSSDVRTITVTVTDDLGDSDDGSVDVTVNNVAPVVDAGGDVNVDEGSPFQQGVPSPVSRWSAEGNATDSVDGNNGTLVNGAVANAPGIIGTAFGLDGSNDYVVVPDAANLRLGNQQTISAWYRFVANGNNDWRRIVGKGDGGNRNYGLWLHPNGTILYQISGGGYCGPSAGVALDGQWHQLVGTYNGSTGSLYLDGNLVNAVGCTNTPPNTGHSLTIGWANADGAAFHSPFSGQIDEVQIWDTPLDAAQVQTLYDNGSTGGSFADPGADTWTGTVNYGDGTGDQPLALNPDKTFNTGHTYGHAGDYTVTVTVSDDDSGVGSDTFVAHVANVAPTITSISADQNVDEGSPTTITALFTDPSWLDTHTSTVDCGTGDLDSGPTLVEENLFPDSTGDVSLVCTYGHAGTSTVTVTVTDDVGDSDTATVDVTVVNVAPTITSILADPNPVDEGSPTTITALFTDPSWLDTHTTAVDCGTGDLDSGPTLAEENDRPDSTGDVTLVCTYGHAGTYTVTVTITDDEGDSDTATVDVVVVNVAPTITDISADQGIDEGSPTTITALFTDPSWLDTHTTTVDCGTGDLDSGPTLVEENDRPDSTGSVILVCTYGHAGTYTVSVTVTDDEGDSDTETVDVVVVNVAPTITSVDISPVSLFEGQSAVITAEFTDPSWLDTHTATIDCGTGTLVSGPSLVEENARPDSTGTVTGECSFDDDQPTTTPIDLDTIIVTVTDDLGASDDGSVGTLSDGITIINVAPEVEAGDDIDVDEGSVFERTIERASGGSAQTGQLPGLVAYYAGEGNADDSSGNGHHGTAQGDLSFAAGQVGQAFTLDGVGDYIVLPDTSTLSLYNHDFTVTAWVNAAAFSGLGGYGGDWALLGNQDGPVAGSNGLHLALRSGQPYMGFFGNDMGGGVGLSLNTWYHITWRYDKAAGQMALFLDGVQINSQGGHAPFIGTGSTFIGRCCETWDSPRYAKGLIDEVKIFDRPLTPAEIGAEASGTGGGAPSSNGSFADPGNDTFTATANYGDGSPVENFSGESFTLSHAYGHAGDYTVTVTVSDDDSGVGSDTFVAHVANVAPTITSILADPNPVDEGSPTTITALFTDPSWLDTHTATVDCGTGDLDSGPTLTEENIAPDSTGDVTLVCTYGHAGTYTVKVTVTDDEGDFDTATVDVTVLNVAPAITVISADPNPVDEGSPTVITASFTDPSWLDTHTLSVDCDGGDLDAQSLTEENARPDSTGDVSATCTFGHAGSYDVSLTVTDDVGDSDTETVTITVTNVAPTITAISGDQGIDEGSPVNIAATFTDPSWLDTHTVTVDCGGGDLDASSLIEERVRPDSTGDVAAVCTFGHAGTYTVTVTVTDDVGDSDTETVDVVVVNVAPTLSAITASAVSITEGQWIILSATFTDPSWLDTHTATVDCGFLGLSPDSLSLTEENARPDSTGTINSQCTYGDNGTFTITMTVTDDLGDSDTQTVDTLVSNVDPMLTLDHAGSIVDFAGGEAFIGRVGVPQSHDASATDPGSDDLTFDWTFSPDPTAVSTTYLNGTGPDALPSPGGTYPTSASDTGTVNFIEPGIYTVAVTVTDDDGGSDSESLTKIVQDDCDCTKSQGFWKSEFKKADEGKTNGRHIDDASLLTYLTIIGYASGYFEEEIALSTIADANRVLNPEKGNNGSNNRQGSRRDEEEEEGEGEGEDDTQVAKAKEKALQQTLAAWLNFAKGGVAWDEDITIDDSQSGTGTGSQPAAPAEVLPFNEVVAEIEAILANPDATKADFERAKDLAEAVNLHDKNNPDCETGSGSGNGDTGSGGGTASAADETQTGTRADTKADDTKADEDTKDESKPKEEPKKKGKK